MRPTLPMIQYMLSIVTFYSMNHMRPFTNDEETDVADAQQALDDLRTFVRRKTMGKAGDQRYALQFQLENLEDMLRVVTDSRYARRLADSGSLSRNAGETDTLQFIISTARSAMRSTTEAAPPTPRQNVLIKRTTKPLVPRNTGRSLGDLRSLTVPRWQPDHPPIQSSVLKRRTALRQASGPASSTGGNPAPRRTERATPILMDITMTPARDRGKGQLRVVNGNPSSPTEASQSETLNNGTVSQVLDVVRKHTGFNGGRPFDLSVDPLILSSLDRIEGELRRSLRRHQSVLLLQGSSKLAPTDGIVTLPNVGDKNTSRINESGTTKPVAKASTELYAGLEPFPTSGDSAEPSMGINGRLPIVEDSESVLDDWVSEPWLSRSSLNVSLRTYRSSSEQVQQSVTPDFATNTSFDSLNTSLLDPWADSPPASLMAGPSRLLGISPARGGQSRAESSQPRGGRTTSARNSLPSLRASLRRPLTPPPRAATLGRTDDPKAWKDTCAACYDTLYHITTQLKAPCGHAYCRECGVNLVKTYTSQESLHPLRCCNIPIPNELVRPVLSSTQYADLLQKEKEYNTPIGRRIYCPNTNCRQFTKIGKIASYLFLRDKMKCPACSSWICTRCKEFVHPGNKCGEENTNAIRFEALVKEQGWQRCGKCHRVVERTYGCLHMTCLCGYEFCYRCGAGTSTKCGHGVFGNNGP